MKPGKRAFQAPMASAGPLRKTSQRQPHKSPPKAMGSSLHRIVAQDIGARILNGEFAPGTLLPNEAEWCKRFGVSRTAVREAIKMLMGKGLILSRPRIGSRVQPREQWNLLDRDVLAWYCAAARQSHFLAHMQQVREILEPETAALAAANHTPEQMRAIEEAYDAMAAAKTLAAWNDADVRFHFAILQAAGNELLVPLGLVIESALGSMFSYTARQKGDVGRTLPGHRRILDAIRARRPAAARSAVRKLLDDTRRIVGQVVKAAGRQRRNSEGARSI